MTDFQTPKDVLDFVRSCLRAHDVERLFEATLEDVSEPRRQRIFADLQMIDDKESLEAVFLAHDAFPKAPDHYKLGGHESRTRHIHIDLIRGASGWRLKSIWKCR